MEKKIRWLRISYWIGAILDGLWIIPMVFPAIGGALFGIENFNPGVEYRYAMYVGASLMAGWTVLLVWADRKPYERKGILLITVIPVIIGLLLANLFAVQSGVIDLQRMMPSWIMSAALIALFLFSYFNAGGREDE